MKVQEQVISSGKVANYDEFMTENRAVIACGLRREKEEAKNDEKQD